MSFQTETPPVTRTQIVRFAGAAGDFNPMHHDEPLAQAAGHPAVFAMGQLTAAILGAALAEWFAGREIERYGVRFRDRVWPGDVLILRADPDGEDRSRYTLRATRKSDGIDVLTGHVDVS
jgi:acyl dehydratase